MADKLEFNPEQLKVPVLPSGMTELIAALTDDALDFHGLCVYLERFPAIVAKLIALSNSAWSSPSSEITTLNGAISRLGLKVSRSVSIAMVVSASMDTSRCPAFDTAHYWGHALLVGDIAAIIASNAEESVAPDISMTRVAGLIHNLGFLVLVDNFPQQLDEQLREYAVLPEPKSLNHYLTSQLGYSPASIGNKIAQSWGLPVVLEKAMSHYDETGYRDEYWPVVASVSLAIRITAALHQNMEEMPEHIQISDEFIDRGAITHHWQGLQSLYAGNQKLSQHVFG